MNEENQLSKELIEAIQRALGTPNSKELEEIALLLAKVASGHIQPEQAQNQFTNKHNFSDALSDLTGKTISTDKLNVSFAANGQLGDIAIQDIIGGNKININFILPTTTTLTSQKSTHPKQRLQINSGVVVFPVIIIIITSVTFLFIQYGLHGVLDFTQEQPSQQVVHSSEETTAPRQSASQEPNPTTIPTESANNLDKQELFQQAKHWNYFFVDQFNNNEGGWYTGSYNNRNNTKGGDIKIDSGKHNWNAWTLVDTTWWLRPELDPVTDFALSIEAQRVEGDKENGYGVVFRLQEGYSYYRFIINDLQQFEVARIINNEVETIIPLRDTPIIKPDSNNKLTVISNKSHFLLYINDQYLDEFTDNSLAQGQIGIIITIKAGKNGSFSYDNLELRTPS